MSTERRTLLQRALRVLLGLGAVVVIALAVAAWWFTQHGEAWLDRTLRERIAEVIDEASVEGYRFTMEELVTDVRSGDLSVTGVRLEFAPGSWTVCAAVRITTYSRPPCIASSCGAYHSGACSGGRSSVCGPSS
ncbi:MAG: hypothetical protein IPL64_04140 [Flavobacteriales bacterium]|nr:hypothetical protein [Flavobacteriales bacterium]